MNLGNAHMVGIEHTCPVCKKVFIPAPEHRYYVLINYKKTLVCTYKCRCEYDKQHPRKRRSMA